MRRNKNMHKYCNKRTANTPQRRPTRVLRQCGLLPHLLVSKLPRYQGVCAFSASCFDASKFCQYFCICIPAAKAHSHQTIIDVSATGVTQGSRSMVLRPYLWFGPPSFDFTAMSECKIIRLIALDEGKSLPKANYFADDTRTR